MKEALTQYYRAAVVNNVLDVAKMKSVVFATLTHCRSTDYEPKHSKCFYGEVSWCFYNKAITKGETPKSHNEMVRIPLNDFCVGKIIPLYSRLTSDAVLPKCV